MSSDRSPSILPLVIVVILPAIPVALLGLRGNVDDMLLPVTAALFLGLFTPVAVIAIRHQVRRNRIQLIELFARSFGNEPKSGVPSFPGASFEFVRGKYFADLDLDPKKPDAPTLADVPELPLMVRSDHMLLFAAVPYILLSIFGILVLFAPATVFQYREGLFAGFFNPGILAIGGLLNLTETAATTQYVNLLTVAGMAFAGAYFFTLRLFLRAVAVFDLSPITFLRAFSHMLLSVALTVVLFRALPETLLVAGAVGLFTPAGAVPGEAANLAGEWYLVAFALGFVPETALTFVLQLSRLTLKTREARLERHAKVIPLTLIDGIDHFTAFRLEEANIFDVQNLTVFNPIMLHIESPYGIYQTIDWVAQAQLCSTVGPERFLLLRSVNVRSVFDLQRLLIGPEADPGLQLVMARIMLSDTRRNQELRHELGMGEGSARVALDGFDMVPTMSPTPPVAKLAAMMLDDLHVHRLTALWQQIKNKIDTVDHPPVTTTPITPPATSQKR